MYWYIRTENTVKGPFPEKQLQESLLLGRVDLNTPVSKDKSEWHPLRMFPELVPEVMQGDPADVQARQRLDAARRWADERRAERRDPDDPSRLGDGRREPESYVAQEYRQHREQAISRFKQRPDRQLAGIVGIVVVILIGLYAGFTFIPSQPEAANCAAEPGPGINWRHCQLAGLQAINQDFSGASMNSVNLQSANLAGADFSHADLSYANLLSANLSFTRFAGTGLKGANLRQTDLSKADFSNADLSYADLTGADISGAVFTGTKLSHVIWVDGQVCTPESVGYCQAND